MTAHFTQEILHTERHTTRGGVYAFSLLGLISGCLATAYAAEPGDYYRFTNPSLGAETLPVTPAAKTNPVIPTGVWMKNIEFRNAILDPSLNGGNVEITYTMPEPGFVTIRVVRQGTRELYLAAILNLQFRDAGTHTETWDGRD